MGLSVALTVLGVALFAMGSLAQAVGQTTVKETVEQKVTKTTMTSSGTISAFGPSSFVLRTTTSADPIRYAYTKATTYVDERGKQVAIENVRPGLRVTVYSDKSGNEMVATRVVVARAVPADQFHD
jgi:hypothetical protein